MKSCFTSDITCEIKKDEDEITLLPYPKTNVPICSFITCEIQFLHVKYAHFKKAHLTHISHLKMCST